MSYHSTPVRIWRVAIRIPHLNMEFIFDPRKPTVLGCAASGSSTLPDINLFGLIGNRFGVSERHAMIALETSGLYMTDQNTPTGTRFENERLKPHVPHPVRQGGRFVLGSLQAELVVISNPLE